MFKARDIHYPTIIIASLSSLVCVVAASVTLFGRTHDRLLGGRHKYHRQEEEEEEEEEEDKELPSPGNIIHQQDSYSCTTVVVKETTHERNIFSVITSFVSCSWAGLLSSLLISRQQEDKEKEDTTIHPDQLKVHDNGKQSGNRTNDNETTITRSLSSPSPQSPYSSMITLQPIGYISSIYRLCVGTPRQGLLAPNSRGRINLFPNRIAFDSIQDLEHFSHVWIVFVFHLNSNVDISNTKTSSQLSNDDERMKLMQQQQFPSKIKPPALGGKKVGIFATRSPHRPNPIGFSLCRIDRVVVPTKKDRKKKNKKQQRMAGVGNDVLYSIDISGLDLVDGTPILDIKPYVPHYDSVGYCSMDNKDGHYDNHHFDPQKPFVGESSSYLDHHICTPTPIISTREERENVKLPQWVSDGLDKRRLVEFTSEAMQQLKEIFVGENESRRLEFYGKHTGRDETDVQAMERFISCIQQVLSVDVRSKWQTAKARKGKSRAETTQRVKEMNKGEKVVGAKEKGNDVEVNTVEVEEKEQQQRDNDDGGFCTQQLDRLLIKFRVRQGCAKENERLAVDTQGSGADDVIVVMGVEYLAL
jgi:Uncharacterized conserved protein